MSEGAALALALLRTGIVDADDFEEEEDPSSFVERSMKRLWAPEGIGRFSYTYGFATREEAFYFIIELDENCYLDFTRPAMVCDSAHEQLGPSLLTHLYACTPLTPAFTPEVCRDYIVNYHWEGWEEAENIMEMARDDLAGGLQVDKDSPSPEDVESYADSHYFTPRRVDSLIEPRYQQPGRLSLEECVELYHRHGFANLSKVCELLGELEVLARGLPKRSGSYYEHEDGGSPFGAIIGLQREGAEQDLVSEIFQEHERYAWEVGEFAPMYALELGTLESLPRLRGALEASKRMLELTQKLYDTLEVTSCLFP